MLGCASGAATAGNASGCTPGAVGGVVGEMAVEFYNPTGDKSKTADTVNFAKVMASVAGVIVGGGGDNAQAVSIAGSAGANAAENNYLKHAEAIRLATLKGLQDVGKCDSNCDREIKDLKALDLLRNENLSACNGITTKACDKTREDVRSAAADYIRADRSGVGLDIRNTYGVEKSETLSQAGNTVGGKASGAIQGAVGTFGDGAIALGKLVMNVFGSSFGDEQSARNLHEGAGATYEFVKDPNNWPQLLGAMSPQDREKLAQAYELGDGKAIGQLMGAQLANLPMGGGGAFGAIKKIDNVVDAANAAKGPGRAVEEMGASTAAEVAKAEFFAARTAPELKAIYGWGNGLEGVQTARGALDVDAMHRIQQSVTRAEVEAARNLYQEAAAAGRGGLVAPERAGYMADILKQWK